MKQKYSYPKEKIKILLLEGIHPSAIKAFGDAEYGSCDIRSAALSEEELIEEIDAVHILGIRSKTQLTKNVIENARSLLAVGCFCIGTNQVDLNAAMKNGVAVFNAPFSNTRSVAELTMAEIVMLARKASLRSQEMHQGIWNKSAKNCFEVRNKTLGIVGYGHIGPQVGTLAEAFGMKVLFYDKNPKLAYGTARAVSTLDELLESSDFVTLHVPETPQTEGMIGDRELRKMKEGSYLLNLSRGSVVDIAALSEALRAGHLSGAAVDVFPEEPASNDEPFRSELCNLPNIILTPHIGGSTVEAQLNIGLEVAISLVKYLDTGASTGAVNFPQIDLPVAENRHRVLHIHRNEPGVLSQVNGLVARLGANIEAQYLGTNESIGYLIMDVDKQVSGDLKSGLNALSETIRTRLLY